MIVYKHIKIGKLMCYLLLISLVLFSLSHNVASFDEQIENTQGIEPEVEAATDKSVMAEEKTNEPFSTSEFHRGDVEIINNMIENNSLNLEYNNPATWGAGGVEWTTEEYEEGMGRRIHSMMLSSRGLTGSLDVRELEYLELLNVSNNPQLTELHVSGMTNLKMLLSTSNTFTDIDVSNLNLEALSMQAMPDLISFTMEGTTVSQFVFNNIPKLKQFTTTNGDTLNIEVNGPGEVALQSYHHNLKQFTLVANATGSSTFSGFSHWIATPNGVDFVSPNTDTTRTTTFTIPDGVDTTMTAYFDPTPIVNAPVIDKDSITDTNASFSGTYNPFGGVIAFYYEFRIKGEQNWSMVPQGVVLDPGDGVREYRGSFANNGITLQPGTTYELRVMMNNLFGQATISDITEFTTSWAVTIRHVQSQSDGGYTLLGDEEIVYIPNGEGITIVAGEYPGLVGTYYKLMKNDDAGQIEDTTYSLGTSLEIFENTTIVVYHASTVVDVSFPKEMNFYAHYSGGGTITTKEEYAFVNQSALPTKVNLRRYDVIETDGVNFVANALHDGDLHFNLLPTASNNNGFTNPISNIQPNVPLHRSFGTLGGYALGNNNTGIFTIGGEYIGLFPVQPKRPTLQFIFSFEVDWDELK